jgi:hypothetical protein
LFAKIGEIFLWQEIPGGMGYQPMVAVRRNIAKRFR